MSLLLLSIRRGVSFPNLRLDSRYGLKAGQLVLPSLSRYSSSASLSPSSLPSSAPKYLQNLNDAQVEAVTQPLHGITRVVAGPGAGKTRVLTCRIAHLLQNDPHSKILAVTFTKKASAEMQERLIKIIAEQNENDYNDELYVYGSGSDGVAVQGHQSFVSGHDRVDVGTFHSICAKILRWNGKELSSLPSVKLALMGTGIQAALDSSFVIMDQTDQLRVLKEVLKSIDIDLAHEKDLKPSSIIRAMEEVKSGKLDQKVVQRSRLLTVASKVLPPYRERLLSSNTLDFNDLICMTAELLDVNATIRETLRRSWSHLLVDEFQDTSQIQMDLVKMLTSKSLFVVGDADQSIYSWRGAHVESMTDFCSSFNDVRTVYLMENYRSTTNIVKAAQKIISASQKTSARELRQDMKPMRGSGSHPLVKVCANAKAEASYVVTTIQRMLEHNEILPQQTVAILYRGNKQSREFEEACVSNGLPYVVRGATGAFYERAEVKDLLCFLRWIRNGRDESAMMRAFKTAGKGLGEKSVAAFLEYCRGVDDAYIQQGLQDKPTPLDLLIAMSDDRVSIIPEAPSPGNCISSRTYKSLVAFSTKMATIREKSYKESIPLLLQSIVDTLGLEDHFHSISDSNEEFLDRMNNVEELRQAAERYSKGKAALTLEIDDDGNQGSPLANFLDDVALFTDISKESDGFQVNLMTIHASKGLEFDVVFLVGNEDGTFPTTQAIQEGENSVALEEERRLCYVAMTRAKNRLILTWRTEVAFFQGDNFRKSICVQSRFLNDLVGKGKLDAARTSAQRRSFSSNVEVRSHKINEVNKSGRLDAQLRRSNPQKESITGVGGVRAIPQRALVSDFNQKDRLPARLKSNPGSAATVRRGITMQNKRPMQEEKLDSTWFFPVGSSVVHLKHGLGTILPPPEDRNGEMMVCVQFENGEKVELPAMTRDLFPN